MIGFNNAPYFDDFDAKKNYHRVLFKPSMPVQTRELNQLQSILQDQIAKFGDSIYKHGTMVVDGEMSYDLFADYVNIDAINLGQNLDNVFINSLIGKKITGTVTGIQAIVVDYIPVSGSNGASLFVRYLNVGYNGEKVFKPTEVLRDNESLVDFAITETAEVIAGFGSRATIKDGVYYINGFFVNVYAQSIILDRDSSTPSYKVGLKVTEKLVSVNDDESLYDNALGSPNLSAPGADRYQISLQLSKRPLDSLDDENFIELLRIENGDITKWVRYTQYSTLGDTMARRTYDESGDYTVNGLEPSVREHLKIDNDPKYGRGVFSVAQGGDAAKFVVDVASGKAYVRGYEIEKYAPTHNVFDKARSTQTDNASTLFADWSNYLLVSDIKKVPNFTKDATVFLLDKIADTTNFHSSIIGSAKVRGIALHTGDKNSASASVWRLYVYDIRMDAGKYLNQVGKLFEVASGFEASLTFSVNTSAATKNFSAGEVINGVSPTDSMTAVLWDSSAKILYTKRIDGKNTLSAGDYITGATSAATASIVAIQPLVETQFNKALFALPKSNVATIRSATGEVDTTYTVSRYQTVTLDGSGAAQLTLTGNETFVDVSSIFGVDENGAVINVNAVQQSAQLVTISGTANKARTVVYSVAIASATEKKVILKTDGVVTVTNPGLARTFSLRQSGVFKVTKVTDNGVDITGLVDFFDGQTDNNYENASIYVKQTVSGPLRIEFSYFAVSGTGSQDYLSVDSYSTIGNAANPAIELIPDYQYNGVTRNLRDFLDFRPYVSPKASTKRLAAASASGSNKITLDISDRRFGAINDIDVGATVYGRGIADGTTVAAVNGAEITLSGNLSVAQTVGAFVYFGLSKTGGVLGAYNDSSVAKANIARSKSIIGFDFKYYLPRIDLIALKFDGEFQVIKGVASENPVAPQLPDRCMAIARVMIPAYTFSVKDIELRVVDNKRYTMRDIGMLDKRIGNLEYVSSLNMLEKSISDMRITDPSTGLDRFKTGILADPLDNHGNGDIKHPDYSCQIDLANSTLRPLAQAKSVNFAPSQAKSTNMIKRGKYFMLPFSEVVLEQQPYATRTFNVNEFMYANFDGLMVLVPSYDSWIDTKYAPDINVSKTEYNTSVVNKSETVEIGQSRPAGWESFWVWGGGDNGSWQENRWVAGTSQSIKTFTKQEINDYFAGMYRTESTNVIGSSQVPFIRNRVVVAQAEGLKPRSQVFAFFDDTAINQWCRPLTTMGLTANNGWGSVGGTGNWGDAIFTDNEGKVKFEYNIPENRFSTGIRTLSIQDNPTYQESRQKVTSQAQAKYEAHGRLDTLQKTITETTVIDRVITNTTVTEITHVEPPRPTDPLAQSFFIAQDEGVFLTKVDLFFAAKDPIMPIKLQIREMDNGYPAAKVIPNGEVILPGTAVNVDRTGRTATSFVFKTPVYLAGGSKDYCFVLLADTPNYEVHGSFLGETDNFYNVKISKQPAGGSVFKSQNNVTWTADQNSDLKYTLYRAKFNAGVSGELVLENKNLTSVTLGNNPFTFSSGSNLVQVYCPNHNMMDSVSKVAFTGVPDMSSVGILAVDMNTTLPAFAINEDYFMVTLAKNATASALALGGNAVTMTPNVGISSFTANILKLEFQNTTIAWKLRGTTGKTIGGDELAYIQTAQIPISIKPNQAVDLDQQMLIASPLNESINLTGEKSMAFYAQLKTGSEFVSPIIIADQYDPSNNDAAWNTLTVGELIAYNNKINNPDPAIATSFKKASGSSNISNFIMQPVTIQMPSTSLQVYLTAYKPKGSNIRVFYRASTGEPLEQMDWVELDPPKNYVDSAAKDKIFEYTFTKDKLASYSKYQIKIAMSSKSKAQVPIINDYRVLALA